MSIATELFAQLLDQALKRAHPVMLCGEVLAASLIQARWLHANALPILTTRLWLAAVAEEIVDAAEVFLKRVEVIPPLNRKGDFGKLPRCPYCDSPVCPLQTGSVVIKAVIKKSQ